MASTRGAHGGYELTREPSEIRMSEVIEALEGPIAPMVCATDHDPVHRIRQLRPHSFCNVQSLWVKVREAVMGALDSMTLADLAGPSPAHPYHSLPIHPSALPVTDRSASTEPVPHA